jgi:hypothetical protein
VGCRIARRDVAALRSVIKYANAAVGADDPRKYDLRVMEMKVTSGHDLIAPVVLFTARELATSAPFIEVCLRDNFVQDAGLADRRIVLKGFKQRMIKKRIWPHPGLSTSWTGLWVAGKIQKEAKE